MRGFMQNTVMRHASCVMQITHTHIFVLYSKFQPLQACRGVTGKSSKTLTSYLPTKNQIPTCQCYTYIIAVPRKFVSDEAWGHPLKLPFDCFVDGSTGAHLLAIPSIRITHRFRSSEQKLKCLIEEKFTENLIHWMVLAVLRIASQSVHGLLGWNLCKCCDIFLEFTIE